MKRNCNDCTALQKKFDGVNYYCSLGHLIQPAKRIYGTIVEYKPLEECEKPKTLIALAKYELAKNNSKII